MQKIIGANINEAYLRKHSEGFKNGHENKYAQNIQISVRKIKSARKFSNFAQPECEKLSMR